MNNFFLLNEAIDTNNSDTFKAGISELITIKDDACEYDHFLKHDSVWNLKIWNDIFADYSMESAAVLKFTEQLRPYHIYLNNENTFDHEFPDMANAFLGFDFSKTEIVTERQVFNLASFYKFRKDNLWEVNFRNFWSRRKLLFPNLILCGEVEAQIRLIGNSGYFSQIVEKLKEMNKAANEWTDGEFNHRIICQNFALNITGESAQTMRKFGSERIFSLPNGKREYFELHIKTGDLRFHFYPNNATREIYIGYIGPHLSTVSN